MTRVSCLAAALALLATAPVYGQVTAPGPAETVQDQPSADRPTPGQQRGRTPPRANQPAASGDAAPTSPQPNCRGPEAGSLTLRREAIIASGTLQLRFLGRDASYPEPAVYCVQTNAELRNADGTPRDNATFCIWEGFVQRGRICGVAFSVQITRANDEQVVLSLRR
jgi:hypothetical protein